MVATPVKQVTASPVRRTAHRLTGSGALFEVLKSSGGVRE